MKSIIQKDKCCYVCGNTRVHDHHIFGNSNRKKSEQYGLKVWLCYEHHNGSINGVHTGNQVLMNELRQLGQKAFEKKYGHDQFMKIFNKNYL